MTAIILTKLIPAIIVALVIGVIAYAALKHFLVPDSDDYTRNALRRLSEDSGLTSQKDFSPVNILKDDVNISSPVGRALAAR